VSFERARHEERRIARSAHLASGTLACPACDAPVAPLLRPMGPAEPLGCGFCLHHGTVRDFLSLSAPTRATHVVVRVRVPQHTRPARAR